MASAVEESDAAPLGTREVSRGCSVVLELVQLDEVLFKNLLVLGKFGRVGKHWLQVDSGDGHFLCLCSGER